MSKISEKETKNLIKRINEFGIGFTKILLDIDSINNLYKKFSNIENIKKDIIDICHELRHPILFYLAIMIRGYKDDIKSLFKIWKNEIKNKDILKEKSQNFKIIFKEILNGNKNKDFDLFLKNLYDYVKNFSDENKYLKKIEGVLNIMCHFFDRENHKNDKKKSGQYDDKFYNWILNNKKLTENFFNLICYLDCRMNGKNEIQINSIWNIKTTCIEWKTSSKIK